MSGDPKDQEDAPLGRIPDDPDEIDRAMLSAISRRQRDNTPLSFDQERLLDDWIAGRLPQNDADRAAELTSHNIFAAEHILELKLIAAANEGPDVPSALSKRILNASGPKTSGLGKLFRIEWPTLSAWQWSGLGATAAAIAVVGVFGLQMWQLHLRSDQSFQIAMVTIEDRSVLLEGPAYRTRGRRQQDPAENPPSMPKGYFQDVEVPIALLRGAINGSPIDKQSTQYSELVAILRTQAQWLDEHAVVLIDSALAAGISGNANERTNIQIRAYNLDDANAVGIRNKIRSLPTNKHSILLTLRP